MGLRVEDVKEAMVDLEKRELPSVQAWSSSYETVAAAARAWLASQATTEGRYVEPAGSSEQTPDYEAAAKELAGWRGGYAWQRLEKAKAIVDAALVGFHPQPEGDER